jgi:hypothetical protein
VLSAPATFQPKDRYSKEKWSKKKPIYYRRASGLLRSRIKMCWPDLIWSNARAERVEDVPRTARNPALFFVLIL